MFAMTIKVILIAALITSGDAAFSASNVEQRMTVQAMEQVFARSAQTSATHMAALMRTMTVSKAVEVLQKHNLTSAALTQVTDMALAGTNQLRKQPKGYAGIDGARKLLNDMIFESMTKYDAEIAKCTEYYSKQCAAMEQCRGQIAASNYVAANSRGLILDSQSTISICEVDIPTRELELKQHILKCKHELNKLNTRLKIVMGDIAVMTMILEMTDCEKKLLQTNGFSMLKCEDQCTKKNFIQFDHEGLQQKVSQLQSTVSHDLMTDTFSDLFSGIESLKSWSDSDQADSTEDSDSQEADSAAPGKLIIGSQVALQGGHRNKFCADEGNRGVKCNRNRIGSWEKFNVVDAGSGKVSLKGGQRKGTKHCADEGNRIKCNRNRIGSWEKFTAVDAGSGKVALKGRHARRYCADEVNRVKCNRNAIGRWERFTVKCLSGCSKPPMPLVAKTAPAPPPRPTMKPRFSNKPVPMTKVPTNACTDPYKGAPSAADKRAAKCTIKKSPQCYKLQERFLLIQAGIQDERDELLEEISMLETFCEETKTTLETQIQNDKDMLSAAQTKLAAATEKEANAGEAARQTSAQNEELNNDLMKQMKTCSGNYINFETELCALKKIRGELYKMKGGGHSAFFQDCEVAKWTPEECTKKCATGEQKLVRGVLTHPNGGAKCLPLAAMRSCNQQPCPVDCKLASWSGWSKCSAKCGGGVQQRLREVKQAMKFNGKPCGKTSEAKACNAQACEADCDLSRWTKWSACSKACDGGTQKRTKFVKKQPLGDGKCPDQWSSKRLQYKKCNMNRCVVAAGKSLTCHKRSDIVLLIDGSGSLGKKGWDAEIKAAQTFVDAFADSGGIAQMAVILYSGPRTWHRVRQCMGGNAKGVDTEKICGIKTITHFTGDMGKVKQLITGLTWPRGSTLTSLALMTAKAELSLGRKDAESTVVIITDGRPLSYRTTGIASRLLRKSARLLWVPVTQYAPLKFIKKWATRRWQENVVKIDSFDDLQKPDAVTRIIADMCPDKAVKVKFGRNL
jgi:hypothetical protein